MRRSTAFHLALLIVVFLATGWMFMTLISQRFSTGEIYPNYSSLRTDPLGAKAFYDSLDHADAWESERNYKNLEKLEGAPDRTLMLLNIAAADFSDNAGSDARFLSKYAAAGGRVVITIDGQSNTWDKIVRRADERRDENRSRKIEERKKPGKKDDPKEAKEKEKEKEKLKDKDKDKDKEESKTDPDENMPFDEALGIFVKTRDFVMTPKGSYTLEPGKELKLPAGDLPEWYSRTALVFEKPKPAQTGESTEKKEVKETAVVASPKPGKKDKWTVLATLKDDIMIAERSFGKGSIVVVTDSYFASNEALLKDPSPAFLAWLVGDRRHVIFDETHLGTAENPGIMTLALRYHLQGFFFAGLVLFALYVWQSSTSLVPPDESLENASNHVAGHGATAGLVSLLRRGLPLTQVLHKGFEILEKSNSRAGAAMQKKMEQARLLLPPPDKKRLPAGAAASLYQRISDILHPKRNQHL
ncbi:MAG: hypothetical protein RL693_1084 [Verrucomicrobiota bacterium]|jgi:hypothetical protein